MQKPVWRMNAGRGVPSDLVNSAMIHPESNIGLYQTTRTRKAKYERVECWACKGTGGIFSDSYCNRCNGKGYTLEAIK